MIAPYPENPRMGALRFEVTGAWSVEEFQKLLLTLHRAYTRVGTVMLLGDLLERERIHNEPLRKGNQFDKEDYTWTTLYGGSPYYRDQILTIQTTPLTDLSVAVQPFVIPLFVDALRLESPGWVQVVGSWNPLKVIADFVSKWRAENTKRLSIQTTADVEREKNRMNTAIERERIRTQFAVEVLKNLPTHGHGRNSERISEVIAFAVQPTLAELEGVATDSRVLGAQAVDPGVRLPPNQG